MTAVDIEKYNEGRRGFDEGQSLLAVFEKLQAASLGDARAEVGAISHALGFADAALDRLRGITV